MLAEVAPNGYPSFACLRSALMQLDDAFGILEDLVVRPQIESASLAADIWRKMMRDVLNLKRNPGGVIADADLRRIVNMIVPQREANLAQASDDVPSDGGITGDDDSMTGDLWSEAEDLFLSETEASDDVQIEKMVCRCRKCV